MVSPTSRPARARGGSGHHSGALSKQRLGKVGEDPVLEAGDQGEKPYAAAEDRHPEDRRQHQQPHIAGAPEHPPWDQGPAVDQASSPFPSPLSEQHPPAPRSRIIPSGWRCGRHHRQHEPGVRLHLRGLPIDDQTLRYLRFTGPGQPPSTWITSCHQHLQPAGDGRRRRPRPRLVGAVRQPQLRGPHPPRREAELPGPPPTSNPARARRCGGCAGSARTGWSRR